jgi:hypothetical protein
MGVGGAAREGARGMRDGMKFLQDNHSGSATLLDCTVQGILLKDFHLLLLMVRNFRRFCIRTEHFVNVGYKYEIRVITLDAKSVPTSLLDLCKFKYFL